MRKALQFLVMCCAMILSLQLHAQEKTVTGKVTDNANNPLSGVTVQVKGTKKFTQTNANGEFTITVKAGETLQFSYVGYTSTQLAVNSISGPVTVPMAVSEGTLGEVVVTAMDIKRNPRELGYSVQNVTGKEIQQTQRENFLNSLQGRVAGLTINPTNGQAGASSQIVLRGFNSLALDNQPLFVVDGVVIDNQTANETSNSGSSLGLVETSSRNVNQTSNRTNDYTNRIADINPNDIESITVLKGPEATALYGSQASSGAIIITTKKGKNTNGKVNISYDNAFRIQHLNRFPQVNNDYDAGNNGVPQATFTYFGPRFADTVQKFDNIKNFFQNAFSQTHNLGVEFGRKNYTFRISGSLFSTDGVVPENNYNKYNFRITNTTKIGKYIDITPAFTFVRSTNDKPRRGAGGYMLNLLVWPVDNDVRNYRNANGGKNPVNFLSPNDDLDNPFFSVNNNKSRDETNRYISTMGININPFSWLQVSGRFSYDTYRSEGYSLYHPLSSLLTKGTGGSLDNYYRNYYGYNHTITATAKKNIGKFTFRVLAGTMYQDYKTEQYSVYGTNLVDSIGSNGEMYKNGSIVPNNNFYDVVGDPSDSSITRASTRLRLNRASKGLYNYSQSRQIAYFGEVSIGFHNYLFLSYSHRFESSSIFPKDFRNYNYPAGSVSLIVTDMIPVLKKGSFFNYWKLRGSRANTARSSAPYANQSVFNIVASSGGGYAYGFFNNNFLLEPEIQSTYELGTELRLLKSKLNLEVTYYNTLDKKQIAEGFRASYGTGYVLNTINVGSTRNKGIEISLNTSPIARQNLNWNVRLNFNKMYNKVLSLPANVPEFYISDTWAFGNARGGLIQGGPTTAITAYGYQRNNQGDILINPANGLPLIDANFAVRGDRNPDFSLGIVNTVRYKNWDFSMLWDVKKGGDVFNGTDMYLTINGKSKRTADRETPIIVNGVLNDGLQNTANPTRNTIVLTPYYQQAYYTTNMPEEEFIEKDINWLRLRDITVSYTFPQQKLKKAKYFKSFTVFLTGNDLLLFTNYTGADPASSTNNASTRGVGGWGFDYGNIATPMSFNFGFRTSF